MTEVAIGVLAGLVVAVIAEALKPRIWHQIVELARKALRRGA